MTVENFAIQFELKEQEVLAAMKKTKSPIMKHIDRIADPDFFNMVEDIKQMIKTAQYRALQTVNQEQIALYWNISKTIVERQQAHG
ncbi:MAG: hypothetical protein JNJ57_17235 [Saprospiraceae bacterium]|nr:hypothetical protein [Saprospiraceae bacterium]